MASWRFSIGSIVSRAANPPVAVSPAAADTDLPLSNLGTGYPDQQGALQWRGDGAYDIDFDLNVLASSSERADAPTGWYDLLNHLAGVPGLPADPPDWGAYGGRTALRIFRPVAQDVEVMPDETVALGIGLYLPAASAATGCRVRVIDLATGAGWEGGSTDDWAADGVVTDQASDDAWLDVSVEITADAARTERSTYRVIIEPIAATYDATTYVYASAPALFAEVDLVAIVGHSLPADATVELQPQPSGTAIALTPAQPSMYAVATTPVLAQTWRLSIDMPSASSPRPVLGEVWIGKVRTMLVGSPVPDFGGEESAPGQIAVEGPRKRREIVPDDARPVVSLELTFRARDDGSFRQIRDEVMRLTRYGADPLLLLPGEQFEGAGRVYHGRVQDRLAWSIITPLATGSARSFAMPFLESPFAAP